MKAEDWRDNNLTTKEIKQFADDIFIILRDKDGDEINYQPELEGICKSYNIDEEDAFRLATFTEVMALHRVIWILSWKVLYERDMHKKTIHAIMEQLNDVVRLEMFDLHPRIHLDSNINTKIEEGDEDDYYDEFSLDDVMEKIKEKEE